jgi:hypothetical protein
LVGEKLGYFLKIVSDVVWILHADEESSDTWRDIIRRQETRRGRDGLGWHMPSTLLPHAESLGE